MHNYRMKSGIGSEKIRDERNENCAIQLDMHKAYVKVESFLKDISTWLGFNNERGVLTHASICFLYLKCMVYIF
jgi:hypothetical protein